MNEDYLWDRSGPPDPKIERLEQTLAPLRYRHRSDLLHASHRAPGRWWGMAAAAAVVALGVALELRTPPPPVTAWQVDSLQGHASMGSRQAAVSMSLRAGQVLRTGGDTEMTLRADEFGTIAIGPDSELRAATNRQMLLEHGQLHARIWAPPNQFVVDTPSARAVDLGCEYTVSVDAQGDGLLSVTMGWVAFQSGDQEVFIPAGASCVTHKRQGPGIPFYQDATEPLRRSLAAFEHGDTGALSAVLAAVRPADAITVWHLLTRVPQVDRGRVFDRFEELVTLPKEVRREDVVRRDAHAIDLCWNALGLENTEWWRGWEARWGT
jgi:FecR protein